MNPETRKIYDRTLQNDSEATYEIKVYVPHGYFKYHVGSMDQALNHGHVIARDGVYRRVNDKKEVELWKVDKVKICGPGLETEYPDTFVRT